MFKVKRTVVSTYEDFAVGKHLYDYEIGGHVVGLLSMSESDDSVHFEMTERLPLEAYTELLESVNAEIFRFATRS